MALFGIYGRHEIADCPLNSKENAERIQKAAKMDLSAILPKYKINKIVGQYHSGLEHTFLWILDAQDGHQIQNWAIDTGMATFNEIKIVPLMTFNDVSSEVTRVWKN